MTITWDEYRAIWKSLTDAQRERIRDKARWEHMTTWAVVMEWPSLIPKRLRPATNGVYINLDGR